MLPDDALCTHKLQKLGVNKDDNLIVYSGIGQMSAASAARVWWTLRVFGHNNVSILVINIA
jgi:thiosulfate/3-mercaptopyruvate sulfurtransferase